MGAKPQLRVAAGILRDGDGRVLIAERRGDSAWAGLWEFPGGKIGAGESAVQALHRELAEELGIEVLGHDHFMRLEHSYTDRHVSIEFFTVETWLGRPSGREGQAIRWIAVERLDETQLLPADAPVIRALQESTSIGMRSSNDESGSG